MSTQAAAMPDSYPVQWKGRLAILALPQHVAHQRATANGIQLRLAVTTGAVQRVLCLNGLDQLIPVHPSLDAAIAAAAQQRPSPGRSNR